MVGRATGDVRAHLTDSQGTVITHINLNKQMLGWGDRGLRDYAAVELGYIRGPLLAVVGYSVHVSIDRYSKGWLVQG